MKTKIFVESLGCSKNTVNAEQMIYLLKEAGYEITADENSAQVAIVNTCGFIDDAKAEAIETILRLASLKEQGSLLGLIVTGCLAQRYGQEFELELPEVDAVLGTGSYHRIVEAVDGVLVSRRVELFDDINCSPLEGDRFLLSPPYSAFLRIAEGCDNHCTYCVIPSIRGKYRSRQMDDILREAEALAQNGARELIVIAQDTTRYGTDWCGESKLPELLRALSKIDGVQWIRVHYMYPEAITQELLELFASEPKLLHYFDIPIQHISDPVLKRMNRRGKKADICALIDKIRALMPDAVIRTSLIVGFPGETEEDFTALSDFLSQYRLERAGVFCYSQEEGSAAAKLPFQIDEETKERRRELLYTLQEQVMDEHSQSLVGKVLQVLCTGVDERGCLGRSYMDSPDIDGTVIFTGIAREGDFVSVRITSFEGCDLYGEKVEDLV